MSDMVHAAYVAHSVIAKRHPVLMHAPFLIRPYLRFRLVLCAFGVHYFWYPLADLEGRWLGLIRCAACSRTEREKP